MYLNILKSTLEYNDKFALKNLLISMRFTWYLHKNSPYLEKILEILKIREDIPIFFKFLDTAIDALKEDDFLLLTLKKSPKELQKSTITWPYYAVYFALDLGDNIENLANNAKIKAITELAIKYHCAYLTYKDKEYLKQHEKFFEECSITIVRTIEYLLAFAKKDNEHLNKLYFKPNKNNDGLEINFLALASAENSLEKQFFFYSLR